MTIRWYDGFEHYGLNETIPDSAGWTQYDNVTLVTTPVSTQTYATRFDLGGNLRRNTNFGAAETIGGLALRLYFASTPTELSSWPITQFRNSSNRAHISIEVNALGQLVAIRGGQDALSADGTIIATSVKALQPGTFNHIETKVKIDGVDGYVQCRVNGRDEGWIDFEGDTDGAFAGDGFIAAIAIGNYDSSEADPWPSRPVFDDICCWDQQVSDNHDGDFIGLQGVYYLPADADGTHEDWQLSTGADSFAMVDDIEPDEDSTYIFSDTAAQKTSVNVADLPANVSSIKCIAALARAKKTDSGTCDMSLGVRTVGGTEDIGDDGDFPITADYVTYQTLFEINPQTLAPWSTAAIPQVLVERTA